MKTRAEVAAWWREESDKEKPAIPDKGYRDKYGSLAGHKWGTCEIRALLDFIYGGPPQHKNEEV